MKGFITVVQSGVSDKIKVWEGLVAPYSLVIGFLILMNFSGPFNLASGGFLATPP